MFGQRYLINITGFFCIILFAMRTTVAEVEEKSLIDQILASSRKASDVVHPNGTCKRIMVRKEVRDLTEDEWHRYVNALWILNANPNGTYRQLVTLHMRVADHTHFT